MWLNRFLLLSQKSCQFFRDFTIFPIILISLVNWILKDIKTWNCNIIIFNGIRAGSARWMIYALECNTRKKKKEKALPFFEKVFKVKQNERNGIVIACEGMIFIQY